MHLDKCFLWPSPGKPALPCDPFPAAASLTTSSPCLTWKAQTLNSAPDPDCCPPCTVPTAPTHPDTTHAHPLPGRPCPHAFKLHDIELPLRSDLSVAWGEQVGMQENQGARCTSYPPCIYFLPYLTSSIPSPQIPESVDDTF